MSISTGFAGALTYNRPSLLGSILFPGPTLIRCATMGEAAVGKPMRIMIATRRTHRARLHIWCDDGCQIYNSIAPPLGFVTITPVCTARIWARLTLRTLLGREESFEWPIQAEAVPVPRAPAPTIRLNRNVFVGKPGGMATFLWDVVNADEVWLVGRGGRRLVQAHDGVEVGIGLEAEELRLVALGAGKRQAEQLSVIPRLMTGLDQEL